MGELKDEDFLVQMKIADIYVERELADRDSMLQFLMNEQRSLLLLNGVAATAVLGLFQFIVFAGANSRANTGSGYLDLLLVLSAALFTLGGWSSSLAATWQGRAQLRFMLTWGSKAGEVLNKTPELRGATNSQKHLLVNDPSDADDRPKNYHLALAIKFENHAKEYIRLAKFTFFVGLVVIISWSYVKFLEVNKLAGPTWADLTSLF
ncbi:MAG: hypothetical protein ABL996_09465 [Micropepsaceae bacterium]